MIGFTALTLAIFIAFGTLLGTLIKQRQAFIALAFGISLPLFFLSGAFGPISFNTEATGLCSALSRVLCHRVAAACFPQLYAEYLWIRHQCADPLCLCARVDYSGWHCIEAKHSCKLISA